MKKLLALTALIGATTIAITACGSNTNFEEKFNNAQEELEKVKGELEKAEEELDEANGSLDSANGVINSIKGLTAAEVTAMADASKDLNTFAWIDAFNKSSDGYKTMWNILIPTTYTFESVDVEFGYSWGSLYILKMGDKDINTEYLNFNNYYTGNIPNEMLAQDWVTEIKNELDGLDATGRVTRTIDMKMWKNAATRQFWFADPSTCNYLPDYSLTCTGDIEVSLSA